MLRKIFGQSILYFLAMYMPLVANIFILPLINKFLTADDYAIYGLTFGYLGLLSGFRDLGLTGLLQNYYFKDRENYKDVWSQFLGFLTPYRVLYGIALTILMYYIFRGRISPDDLWLYLALVVVPVVFFDYTKNIGVRLCQFENKHKVVYISTLVSGIITISTTFTTIYIFRMGFIGWFISAFIARFFEFLFYGYYLYYTKKIRPNFRFSWSLIKSKLIIALPLIPEKYSNYLVNNSDRAMLDLFRAQFQSVSLAQIGLYNIGYNFANYFGSFNQAVNTVVSPIYFRLFARDDKDAGKTIVSLTLLWFTFSLATGFILCLWLKEIIFFLYPKPEFHDAYKYSIFIIMSLCYRPLFVSIIDKTIFKEKTKSTLKITLIAGAINVILNCFAIPLWGIHGAVMSSFVSYVFMGFGTFLLKEYKPYIEPDIKPWPLLLMLLTISTLAFYLKDAQLETKLIISALFVIGGGVWYVWKGKKQIIELNKISLKD